jgi:hypothetical protein
LALEVARTGTERWRRSQAVVIGAVLNRSELAGSSGRLKNHRAGL